LKLSYILVVKRGNCTFITKANYAQLAGAKMVLVVDNIDESESDRVLVAGNSGKFLN
jgi:hypothetical protein